MSNYSNDEIVNYLKNYIFDNFNLNDQKEVWKYFGECSDTFSLCRIPCVVGEVKAVT